MVFKVKKFFGYDDSLDAFGVHGVGGTMGALLTGLFASGAINAVFGKDAAGKPLPTGAIDGNWHQVLNQAVGVGIGWALAIVGTLVLLFLVDRPWACASRRRRSRRPRPLPARRGRLRPQLLIDFGCPTLAA